MAAALPTQKACVGVHGTALGCQAQKNRKAVGCGTAGVGVSRLLGGGIYTIAQSYTNLFRVRIIHTMTSADLIRRLTQDGWTLRGVKGSHHIYRHARKPGHVSVPHPKKDLGVGLVNKLLKQAGLK